MQQAMMELYKKEKVNPAAGCFPLLITIPIFYGLYYVLRDSVELRQAPFFGWIHDLSAPDPTSVFNLFGLLPFAAPGFLHVGVWPLIMGITMWVQMQLNPQQADPMQQKIFNWMPVMFTFLLANFASGLVIYWAWNNLLSVTQQYIIMRRNGAEIHLWKNLGVDRLAALLGWGQGSPQSAGNRTDGGTSGRSAAPERAGAETPAPSAPPLGDGSAAPVKPVMTREQALKTLGLAPGATTAQIEAAYKARARQHSNLNGSDRLNQARDVLRGQGS
jgi:YidC/Oxa1 family membrane protein insertase